MHALFPDRKIDYIWYANKPPQQGGIPCKLTIEQFMGIYEKKGYPRFEYTETLWAPDDFNPTLIGVSEGYEPEIAAILKKPSTDRLTICFIDPIVGFGVFARENIAKGEVVSIYAGDITLLSSSHYSLIFGEKFWSVDAEKKGGISRFFSHLPYNVELEFAAYEKLIADPTLFATHLRQEGAPEAEVSMQLQFVKLNRMLSRDQRFQLYSYQSGVAGSDQGMVKR
jgi:hypothetical protein